MSDDVLNPIGGNMPGNVEEQLAATQQATEQQIAAKTAAANVDKPAARRRLSTDELYEMIRPKKTVTPGTPASVITPNPIENNMDEGMAYSAYRQDANTPGTQVFSGVRTRATNNPYNYDIGGRVYPGAGVYAENPLYTGEESTFYLKRKFDPVKPYKLTAATGDVVEVDTANKKKAAYLAVGMTQPGEPIDWFGYNRILPRPHEGFFHGAMRGAVNAMPGLLVGAAGELAQLEIDVASLFTGEDAANFWANVRKEAVKVTDDLTDDLTWQFGPNGIADRDANKAGYILGNVGGSVFPAFLNGMALLGTFNALEAAASGYQIRSAMIDKGVAPWKGAAASYLGAAGVFAIGETPIVADKIMGMYAYPVKTLDRLARVNPAAWNRIIAQRKLITAIVEGLSEPGQDLFTDVVSGEDPDWEALGWTFLWSMLMSSAAMALDKNTTAEKYVAEQNKYKKFLLDHLSKAEGIVQGSFGMITTDNIDSVLEQVMNPEAGARLVNMLKESMVANFDKITDEDKARLQEYVKRIDPQSSLENEFALLDERVEKMLDESSAEDVANGGNPLTEEQRQLVKLILRGVAARQLTSLGVLPSQMEIPTRVSGRVSKSTTDAAGANVVGVTDTDTGAISINNSLPGISLPQQAAPVSAGGAASLSAGVQNEVAAANVSSPQTLGFGGLSHEFWHWIEDFTQLPSVGEFVATAQNIVEQIVPGLTEGKTGPELSEAFAYGLQYAGDQTKAVLGLTGKTADYIEFMNLVANAEEVATGTVKKLRNYMQSMQAVLKNNKGMVDSILKTYSTPQVRNAVRNFIRSGDASPLTFDDLRALNAAVSSIGDASTSDNFGQIFDSVGQMNSFMQRYADEYDNLMAKDRGIAASNFKATMDAADRVAGVSPVITPATAKQNTVLSKADDLITQEETEPDEKPQTKQTETKTETKPAETTTEEEPRRMRTDGTSYDVDELVRGNFDDAPELVTGYFENAVKWIKEDNLTRGDLEGRSARVSFIGTTPILTLNPSLGTSRADHRAAYVILAKNKLKQMEKQGKLTPELKQRAKNTGMFAVASNTRAALDAPLELLAARVASNEAKPDEVALYKAIREFNNKLDSIYVEFGPYTPKSQAEQALSATNELLTDLQELSRGSDKNVKALISGQASNEGWIETAFGNRVVSREKRVRPYKRKDGTVVMTADFGAPRSLIDVISDYHDKLIRIIENEESDIDPIVQPDDKPSKKEAQMIGIVKSAQTSPLQKYRARAYLGAIGQNAADEIGKYFRPDYNEEYSDRNIAVETLSAAEAFAANQEATEEERAGAAELVRQQRVMSPYLNAINGYLKRDIIHTPTPLEELGISMERAEEEIRAAGLEPYSFMQEDGTVAEVAKQLLTNEYIGRRLNSENPEIALKTRRTMLARLLQEIKPIGNSKNRAEQLQVLHAISSAKAAVDQLFSAYIDREDSYNNNPTMSPQAFESAHEFVKSDRFPRILEEHLARGYTEEIAAQELGIADEVMFPYGNNMFRGVVAFKFKTPAGARGLVIYEDVDIDAWRSKDLATVVKPPRQLVVSEANLNDIGVMRKPLENSDPSRFAQLSKLFDDVCALHENFTNYRRVAEAAIADTDDESLLLREDMPESIVESDEAAETSEYDADDEANLYTEMFAVASGSPLVDPGAFALMESNMTPADWTVYNQTQEGYMQAIDEGTVTPAQRQYMWEMLHERQTNKSESLKPRFARFGAARLGVIQELRNALKERKINKILLMGAWGTSLDRKGRSIFGDVFSKRFNTVMASSRAQSISEAKRHALDQAVTKEVFNDSRVEYERWLRQKSLDTFDTTLYNGLQVKVTRGEIITLAMAKKAVEKGLINVNEYTNEYERMAKTYSNVDELLGHLSEQDMKFVDVGLNAIANARGTDMEGQLVPAYWVPSVLATDYVANGWDARPSKTPDNSFAVISSQEALAAPDAFDAILSLIGNSAMKQSHLMDELQLLHDVMLFKDVDLGQFKSLNEDEVALYDALIRESALLRQDLQNKIGATMSKWFVENIKTDLKYNPALKELAANPVLGAFQRLTRTVASSLLIASPKQGLVNLGNYHLFLGLSDSGQVKFYTADWMNAVSHLRDAWKLALENPEFKRRLEQSGLSEQMRRVADMNEDSFLTDLQDELYKRGKTGISNTVGSLNTFSKIATKYGLSTNVIPDFLGIALGNYAVYNDVLTRNNGSIAKTQQEIADFVLNRVSSSNFETRSAATKTLQKMGLEAAVLFQNDQLQKIGMMCEAGIRLMNSSDPAVRKQAWKDIQAATYSTLRYVAIQAGWLAAVIRVLSGSDLSDEEEEYLYEATLRETLSQIGGTTQLGSVITPVLNGMFGGRDMGVTLAPYGSLQRMSTAMRKGDVARVVAEVGALSGVAPIAPASVRIMDGLWKMASEDDREFMVGLLMLGGRSPATSEKMLGLTRSPKTGKLKPKKSNKKKDDKD